MPNDDATIRGESPAKSPLSDWARPWDRDKPWVKNAMVGIPTEFFDRRYTSADASEHAYDYFDKSAVLRSQAPDRGGIPAEVFNRPVRAEEVIAALDTMSGYLPIPTNIERAELIEQVQKRVSTWARATPRIFRRGTTLVRVAKDADTDRPMIVTYDRHALSAELPNVVEFVKPTRGGDPVPCDPPPLVVSALLSFTDRLDLPVLNQVVTTPVFAPDGTLITEAGYSSRAHLWYEPLDGMQLMPPVSVAPTDEEIRIAREWIIGEFGMFGQMPWVRPRDRAHACALVIQPFCRPLIKGPCPLYPIEAPTAGTGKSLIVDCVQTLVFGDAPPGGVLPESDDETRKRITAMLLKGGQFIFFDNVNHTIDSPTLAAALIRTTWEDRILGESRTAWLPNLATWVVTAKNPTTSKEIARRCAPIALDAGAERPWERQGFHHEDLLGWVRASRPTLIWAILTIIQAWISRGRPALIIRKLGSFEVWSAVMGGIVEHVMQVEGFLTGMDDFYADTDTETDVACTFLERWWSSFGDRPVTANELWPLASELGLLSAKTKDPRASMGLKLNSMKNTIHCDYRVVKTTVRSHWQLERHDASDR